MANGTLVAMARGMRPRTLGLLIMIVPSLVSVSQPAHAAEGDRTLHSPGLAAAGSILATIGAVGLTTGTYFALTHEPCPEVRRPDSSVEAVAHAACVGASDVPAELGVIGLIAGGASFLAPAIPMMIVGYWPQDDPLDLRVDVEIAAGRATLRIGF